MIRSAQDLACESLLLAETAVGPAWCTPKHEVVLVEDDAGMRQAIARMLVGAGYAVKAFESAEAVLEAPPASTLGDGSGCFVCDVRLPGVSGFELHRRLGEKGRRRRGSSSPPMTARRCVSKPNTLRPPICRSLLKAGRLLALIARVIDPP